MQQIIQDFGNALFYAKRARTEPKIIEKFVTSVDGIRGAWSGGHIRVRSKFIHQNPYAFFVSPPKLHGRVKTELGDVLFVVYYKKGEVIQKSRACILQAKLVPGNSVELTPHQHDFQRDIFDISFKFGKRHYRRKHWVPIVWAHVTRSKWFITNLFLYDDSHSLLYPDYDCIASARDIDSHLNNDNAYRLNRLPCSTMKGMSFLEFLERFILCQVGHRMGGQVRGIVNHIYCKFGWTPDPEEEWLKFWGKNPGKDSENEGFGIVEITVQAD